MLWFSQHPWLWTLCCCLGWHCCILGLAHPGPREGVGKQQFSTGWWVCACSMLFEAVWVSVALSEQSRSVTLGARKDPYSARSAPRGHKQRPHQLPHHEHSPVGHHHGRGAELTSQAASLPSALPKQGLISPPGVLCVRTHPSVLLSHRKRQLSPQSKSSSKVTSIPGKAAEPGPAGAKGGKSSTLSRREELLKQLKAVEDAIARKRAKIPGKV